LNCVFLFVCEFFFFLFVCLFGNERSGLDR